ncbi:MAG: hypothetical protein AAFV53_28215 [Myxococcota bacterium]
MCDEPLMSGLTALLGAEAYKRLLVAEPAFARALLLEACEEDRPGRCAIVRLTLSRDADEETYDRYIGDRDVVSEACEDHPEEWFSRAVWQRSRILEARQTVVEWECRRMFGVPCNQVDDRTELLEDWDRSMQSASIALDTDTTWWMEISRFNPEAINSGTLLECWGDPTDPTEAISDKTGGDCNNDESGAHRDNPEGPDDLIGLYIDAPASCDTCLDGIDNNCDGSIDCADPACALFCRAGGGLQHGRREPLCLGWMRQPRAQHQRDLGDGSPGARRVGRLAPSRRLNRREI